MRKCVICGARVRNENPKTKTCSPDCTAKLHGKPPPEPYIPKCKHCGLATEDGSNICDGCYSQYTPTMLDELGDDE